MSREIFNNDECYGAPVGIRTPNLLIRSQVLYPVELRAHNASLQRIFRFYRNLRMIASNKLGIIQLNVTDMACSSFPLHYTLNTLKNLIIWIKNDYG